MQNNLKQTVFLYRSQSAKTIHLKIESGIGPPRPYSNCDIVFSNPQAI